VKRLFWFVVLWAVGVVGVGAVALIIRAVFR
jgi:hypothetical protein